MLVNLTDVFASREKVVDEQFTIEWDTFTYAGSEYAVLEKEPIRIKISNIGIGKALVEGEGKVVFNMQCDRCLTDVPCSVDLLFSYEVFSPDYMGDDADEDEEINFMEDYELNVEILVNNEILMSWPMKVLCKPQCKGICTVCGRDLNTGECGCDTFVPDPRWAALKDIFNANKEV